MSTLQPNNHRARVALQAWGAAYPEIWRLVDAARQNNRGEWPPHIFLPMTRAGVVMAEYLAPRGWRPTERGQLLTLSSELALFSAWRVTQGVYRFDPAIYQAIVETPITGDIPGELLRYLPEWCVYVETPDMSAPTTDGTFIPMHGVWAVLDYDRSSNRDVLCVGLDTDRELAIGHIPILGTLEDGLRQVERDWAEAIARGNTTHTPRAGYAAAARRAFAPILSLLLYLCSEASEIGDGRTLPVKPQPKRTKNGWRTFAADRPTTWDVGVRIGAALRRAAHHAAEPGKEPAPTGRHVRAHIRRAHWHTFLAGEARSQKRVKWLPPISVNVDEPNELPAVVRSVT